MNAELDSGHHRRAPQKVELAISDAIEQVTGVVLTAGAAP